MSSQAICIAANRLHHFRSRQLGSKHFLPILWLTQIQTQTFLHHAAAQGCPPMYFTALIVRFDLAGSGGLDFALTAARLFH